MPHVILYVWCRSDETFEQGAYTPLLLKTLGVRLRGDARAAAAGVVPVRRARLAPTLQLFAVDSCDCNILALTGSSWCSGPAGPPLSRNSGLVELAALKACVQLFRVNTQARRPHAAAAAAGGARGRALATGCGGGGARREEVGRAGEYGQAQGGGRRTAGRADVVLGRRQRRVILRAVAGSTHTRASTRDWRGAVVTARPGRILRLRAG